MSSDQPIEPIPVSENPEQIETFVKRLLNQQCSRIGISYGDSLNFEFGALPFSNNDNTSRQGNTAWLLNLVMAYWELYKNGEMVSTSRNEREVFAPHLAGMQSLFVTQVHWQAALWEMQLDFGEQYRMIVRPAEAIEGEEDDVRWWNLFMPDVMVLICGPQYKWEVTSSHSKFRSGWD